MNLYPAWILIAWSVIPALAGRHSRKLLGLVFPVLAGYFLLTMPLHSAWQAEVFGLALTPFRLDELSRLFVLIFLALAWLGNLYGLSTAKRWEFAAAQLYAAASVAAVLAGDLLTLLVCWELMAVASTVLIWTRGTEQSLAAGWRFLLVHMTGGALFMAGMFLHVMDTSAWTFAQLPLSPGGWLIFASFCLNAALVPLHAWLPDAYPESSPFAGVFLCCFTTKTAVYALARGFAGVEALAWIGVISAVYGVVFALMQNDIRRLLSYHIICQIGYMVVGIGLGTATAVNGGTGHAFNHILYKGLLFMSTGAVLHMTGRSKLTELGGLLRRMPVTFVLFMVGALSIAGLPWFNGFISKSLIFKEAAAVSGWMEALLIASAAGTFLSIALKLAYFAFVAPAAGAAAHGVESARPMATREAPVSMKLAMTLTGLACVGIGVVPSLLYALLPHPESYNPYSAVHVLQTVQLFAFTWLGFALLKQRLTPHAGHVLDVDWLYREAPVKPVRAVAAGLSAGWEAFRTALTEGGLAVLQSSRFSRHIEAPLTNKPAHWLLITLVVAAGIMLF